MDAGTVLGVLGIAIGLATALWQNRKAEKAQDHASKLERHLEKGRWQQLRSLGEQIDVIEKDRRHELNAEYAAVGARLHEQFTSVLSHLVEVPNFSPALVKHWATVGRLTRPWQIKEAMSHLAVATAEADPESMAWLNAALGTYADIRPLPSKPEMTVQAAAYMLVADRHAEEVAKAMRSAGVSSYAVIFVLGLLAFDEAQLHYAEKRAPTFRTVNHGKPFKDILQYYSQQEFYLVCYAKDAVIADMRRFEEYFLDAELTKPTAVALERARALFSAPV